MNKLLTTPTFKHQSSDKVHFPHEVLFNDPTQRQTLWAGWRVKKKHHTKLFDLSQMATGKWWEVYSKVWTKMKRGVTHLRNPGLHITWGNHLLLHGLQNLNKQQNPWTQFSNTSLPLSLARLLHCGKCIIALPADTNVVLHHSRTKSMNLFKAQCSLSTRSSYLSTKSY